ncbi:hypothetical protein A616_17110 [Brevibacillus brevis X23]|nr:hypothetical protein A616_17110 [Brevibacillus brevis X23]
MVSEIMKEIKFESSEFEGFLYSFKGSLKKEFLDFYIEALGSSFPVVVIYKDNSRGHFKEWKSLDSLEDNTFWVEIEKVYIPRGIVNALITRQIDRLEQIFSKINNPKTPRSKLLALTCCTR